GHVRHEVRAAMTFGSACPSPGFSMGLTRNGKQGDSRPREPRIGQSRAEAGIILMDLALRPIALDWGAADMFADPGRRPAGAPLSVPRELLDVIRRPKPGNLSQKVPFRLGTRDYSCRVYLLESHELHQGPVLAIYPERGLSVHDAVARARSEYGLTDREH